MILSCPSNENLMEYMKESNTKKSAQEKERSRKQDRDAKESSDQPPSTWSWRLSSLINGLKVLRRVHQLRMFRKESESPGEDGYETAEEYFLEHEFTVSKPNLFDEKNDNDLIPREKIMKRIDSHKGMKSYQLAQQLSCRWTTGAGPRIGCMRDYPSELQVQVLEQTNLSPRATNLRSPRPASSISRFSAMDSTTSSPSCKKPNGSGSPLSPVY